MKVIIAGAGTYGSVYHKYLIDEAKHDVIGFVDDDRDKIGTLINGLKVICQTRQFKRLKQLGVEGVICTIGNNKIRQRLLKEYLANGFELPCFIHESVIMSDNVKIGKAVYILPGTIIMPFAEIHDFSMISMGVKLAHHTILREGSFLSTGVNMGANIDFGVCSFAGIGSTISTDINSIGKNVTIGAGAVLIHDVPDNAVVVGNPGRIIKYNQ
jgi:sugar O-acyltransferase (sialic acid O-acetyltransferase NeuD family)